MVLLTKLGLVHGWYVYFFLQFVFTVGKGTIVTILTKAGFFEAGTELSLFLNLVVFGENSSVVLECVWILLSLSKVGFLVELILSEILLTIKFLTKITLKLVSRREKWLGIVNWLRLDLNLIEVIFSSYVEININRDFSVVNGHLVLVNLRLMLV
jgi:hypothetical protein